MQRASLHIKSNKTAAIKLLIAAAFALSCVLVACAPAQPGPDKQFAGYLEGAATGAGTGAVTGLQVGAGTGPGALLGAGLGAVAGGIRGAVHDVSEDSTHETAVATIEARKIAWAQEVLQDQYKKRLDLHPSREIYPADIFFNGAGSRLTAGGQAIVDELCKLNSKRLPWTRLVIASYIKGDSSVEGPSFELAKRRSMAIFNGFVRSGMDPRRLESRAVVMDTPILLDPYDDPLRYSQAVELIALEK